MKEKTHKATGYTYKPMPSKYHDERTEMRTRQHIEDLTAELAKHIDKFRANGVTISDENELRQLTPEAIRKQIQATRQRRLGERFLPSSIRQSEETEFNRMELTLIPLAEGLQNLLKNIPFHIHVGAGGDTYLFDGVEEYIAQYSTVEIPQYVIDYYDHIQKVCAAWHDLLQWTQANGFAPPSQKVMQILAESGFRFEPDQMYNLWSFGTITKI